MEWRDKYNAVINSFRWKGLKMRLIEKRGKTCERCKKQRWPLELHHKTYERLGVERDDDLELLCTACHADADQERAVRGERKSSKALYDARLDGWARKKYGDDWADGDGDSIAEEFGEWLDSQIE